MKKFKKLNRKGFTLIELLAVIVILAVIMVIASTSVLSSMNESRKKSLINTTETAVDSFSTTYAESALVVTDTILGLSKYGTSGVLTGNSAVALTNAESALDINNTDYDLGNSFVYFDPTTSKFLVCFVAREGGNFYVGAAASSTTTTKTLREASEDVTAVTKTLTGMWACSDGTNSWNNK